MTFPIAAELLRREADSLRGYDPRDWRGKRLAAVLAELRQIGYIDTEATCDCGHTAGQHQSGEGAWAGFCSGTLNELGGEYLYDGANPDEPCACERFIDVEAIPDINDPAWPGYVGNGLATDDVLVAPPNAKRVGA